MCRVAVAVRVRDAPCGAGVTEIESAIAKRAGKTLHVTPSKVKGYNFEDPQFAADFERSAPNAEQISMFKVSLAVNHAVLLEQDPDDPSGTSLRARTHAPTRTRASV